MEKIICKKCGAELDINEFKNLGKKRWYNTCQCGDDTIINQFDYTIPSGTYIIYGDNKIGIVDGNDSIDTESFSDINYYVCPIEFTKDRPWSNHYVMLRRKDFTLNFNKPKIIVDMDSYHWSVETIENTNYYRLHADGITSYSLTKPNIPKDGVKINSACFVKYNGDDAIKLELADNKILYIKLRDLLLNKDEIDWYR